MKSILYILFLFIFYTISLSFSGKGSGTIDDPFQITNISQLQEINDESIAHYILMNDIDAKETRYWNVGDHDGNPSTPNEPMGFVPISLGTFFKKGFFNGAGFIIKDLYINRPLERAVALFSIAYGDIKKVGLENCNITGCDNVSSLCAEYAKGYIEECYTTGLVIVKCHGNVNSGFSGFLTGGRIRNSYSSCDVSDDSSISNYNSTSFCDIFSSYSNIDRCYTIGKVLSSKKVTAFGLFGNAYFCFWDVETTGIPDAGGHEAIGLPTSEMKKKATYGNGSWDFDSIWCIDEGRDYPKLRAFGKCPPTDVPQEPKDNGNKLDAFPNPAFTSIDVVYKLQSAVASRQSVGTAQIIITNSYGQQVYNENVNYDNANYEQRQTIDISKYPSGLYFITLRSPAVAMTKGVVVVK
ncbi:MAG: T9SS type A sorting domain-containing protein [Bacteroidetes bacterium]|nr:MAG: T9SS type A sorting domain-containing protein [Bacteroidota bacterium]